MKEVQQTKYKVIFLGPAQDGFDYVNKLTQNLRERFNLSIEAVARLMKSAPVTVKKEVTLEEAQKYKRALEAIGARVKLEPIADANGEHEEKEKSAVASESGPQVIPLREQAPPPSQEAIGIKETGERMIQCPQCGFVQPETNECIKCGIIISKFLKQQEQIRSLEGKRGPTDLIGTSAEGEKGYTPWEDMGNLGVITAFFRTIKEVLFSPTLFFQKMPVGKGIQNPLLYGVIIGFLGGLFTLLWQYTFSSIFGRINIFFTSYILIYAFFLPLLIAIGLFIVSGILHLSLMVVGGGRKGFEATFRVVAYTNSTGVFSIVPLLGGFIAGIYNIVLWIIGLRESHRISTGKATLAVFLPVIVAIVFSIIVFFMIFIPLITSQTHMMQPPPSF